MLAVTLTGLLAAIVATSLTSIRLPAPRVHDEFSYLLAADTFASGRLTNPTHPHWQHFESFHIIQQPSYASKYQPGQGAVLAFGTLVGGHPIVGAWLATAFAAAATCWMLQGWVPNRWALVGGLLVALHATIHARWSLSYWGGSLPMAGGALMLGALPRIIRGARVIDSLLLASGALILVATRPFEGFVVGVCVSAAVVAWLIGRNRPPLGQALFRVVLPAGLFLCAGLAFFAYYNLQVTGDPFRMPYLVHEATYSQSPLFLWQNPRPTPKFNHEVISQFQTGWATEDCKKQQTLAGWLSTKGQGLIEVGLFYFGFALCIPLLMSPTLLRLRKLRFAWLTLAVFLVAQLMVPWTFPHYFAPAAPLLFLVAVEGLRFVNILPRAGYQWVRIVVPTVVALHIIALSVLYAKYVTWQPDGWEWSRFRLLAQLEKSPDKHLIFVHYNPDHNVHAEWVYNRANIDQAKVVWAREGTASENQALVDYFKNRCVWRINADDKSPELLAIPRLSDESVAAFGQDQD